MGLIKYFSIFTTVVLIIVLLWYISFGKNRTFPMQKLTDLLDRRKFKTGDLLLFKGSNPISSMQVASYFNHVAIIVINPYTDKPHILEATHHSYFPHIKEHKNGIYITDLDKRIERYSGQVYYKELAKSLTPEQESGFFNFCLWCQDNMNYNLDVITNGAVKGFTAEPLNLETNCGELTTLSLIKLGLLNKEYLSKNIFHHVKFISDLKNVNKNYYQEPVEIIVLPF